MIGQRPNEPLGAVVIGRKVRVGFPFRVRNRTGLDAADDRLRRVTSLECRNQCERLPRRAGLPARLGDKVELVGLKSASRDHCFHSARPHVDAHQRGGELVTRLFGDCFGNHFFGNLLERGVERCVDPQPAIEHRLVSLAFGIAKARVVEEFLLDLFDKIGRPFFGYRVFDGGNRHRRRLIGICFVGSEMSNGNHSAENNRSALPAPIAKPNRVISGWISDHSSDERALRNSEL